MGRGILFVILILAWTNPLQAQRAPGRAAQDQELDRLRRVRIPAESDRTRRRLQIADKLVEEKKWVQAVDEYHSILVENSEDLVNLQDRHFLQARRLCQLRLAALPPEALKVYRARVDAQARNWLEEGKSRRNESALRRLVDQAFCSRHADEALELLGDLAFERGDLDLAESWWRMIAVPASEMEMLRRVKDVLVFPDPQVDVARVRAKQFLARLFRSDGISAQEWQAFQAVHAGAQGHLAGTRGEYVSILERVAGQERPEMSRTWLDSGWTTFGAATTRNALLPRAGGRLARLPQLDGPLWRVSFQSRDRTAGVSKDAEGDRGQTFGTMESRYLAFHPVVSGDRVFVCDARAVAAYELRTGRQVLQFDIAPESRGDEAGSGLQLPSDPDQRYTLTVHDDRLYARLGGRLGQGKRNSKSESWLACLNLNGKLQRWVVQPPPAEGQQMFEGAPIVEDGRVYVAVTRLAATQWHSGLACYSADSGALLWQTPVCEVQESTEGDQSPRLHLLTRAGRNIVYCSHSGAIVAIDRETGKPRWTVRYPSRGSKTSDGTLSPRGLSPCVFWAGRVFAAPHDLGELLCLDAESGQIFWTSQPLEVIHLFGVARGKVIFTTTTPRRGIRALDAVTGSSQPGWFQPAFDDLTTFGRGFLAGDWVFWPTQRGLYVLSQEDGEVVTHDENIRGNLAAASGCLVVAGRDYLETYVPDGFLLNKRRQEASLPGSQFDKRFRLALSAIDAGLLDQGLDELLRIEANARPHDSYQGRPLIEVARQEHHALLLAKASNLQRAGALEPVAEILVQAGGRDFPAKLRVQAIARLAAMRKAQVGPAAAWSIWQTVLGDKSLEGELIHDDLGNVMTARQLAELQMHDLIRKNGPQVFQAQERAAGELLAGAPAAQRAETLLRVQREFPFTSADQAATLELADRFEKVGKLGAAVEACRACLRRSRGGVPRADALLRLARLYARQQLPEAAARCWQFLAAEYGDTVKPEVDPVLTIKEYAIRELERLDGRSQMQSPTTLYPPFVRERPLLPFEAGTSSVQVLAIIPGGRFLLRQGSKVALLNTSSEQPLWTRELSLDVKYVGIWEDLLLFCHNRDKLAALRLDDGEFAWFWKVTETVLPPTGNLSLEAFQLAGGRLHFLQDRRRLIVLDAATGRGLWSAWSPGARIKAPGPAGRFRSHYLATSQGVVLQTNFGVYQVFDGNTGRKLTQGRTVFQPWPAPPVAIDDCHVCIATDAGQVVALDLVKGTQHWNYTLDSPSSLTGIPPQILAGPHQILIAGDRNAAIELHCLAAASGKLLWSRRLPPSVSVDLQHSILGEHTAILVGDGILRSVALADGRELWTRPMPDQCPRWRLVSSGPAISAFRPPPDQYRFTCGWLGTTLDCSFNEVPEALPADPTWLVLDESTGRVIQRLNPGESTSGFRVGATRGKISLIPRLVIERVGLSNFQMETRMGRTDLYLSMGSQAWHFVSVADRAMAKP